jgi:3-hydroxybutyrate dehydrogenase
MSPPVEEPMRLKDKVAVISGAASGIGKEIARTFANEGAKVVIADRDGTSAEATAAELDNSRQRVIAVAMDVSNESQVEAGIDSVISAFGRIDILVSNAGIQIVAPIEELSYTDWKQVLAIHLDGAFLTTRAVLRPMYRQGGGTIIYIGSVHSKEARFSRRPTSPQSTGSSAWQKSWRRKVLDTAYERTSFARDSSERHSSKSRFLSKPERLACRKRQ